MSELNTLAKALSFLLVFIQIFIYLYIRFIKSYLAKLYFVMLYFDNDQEFGHD